MAYETYNGAYGRSFDQVPATPAENAVQEDGSWAAMRAALPGRLAAMEYGPERIAAFMAQVPERREEQTSLGFILQTTVTQPDFVTLGPAQPEMQLLPEQLFTHLEQGEL